MKLFMTSKLSAFRNFVVCTNHAIKVNLEDVCVVNNVDEPQCSITKRNSTCFSPKKHRKKPKNHDPSYDPMNDIVAEQCLLIPFEKIEILTKFTQHHPPFIKRLLQRVLYDSFLLASGRFVKVGVEHGITTLPSLPSYMVSSFVLVAALWTGQVNEYKGQLHCKDLFATPVNIT